MANRYADYFPVYSRSSAIAESRHRKFTAEGSLKNPELGLNLEQKQAWLSSLLRNKIHGLAFSPYLHQQAPGIEISPEQIQARLAIIAPYCRWIRTFSCRHGLQAIGAIAHSMGLKTMIGVDISADEQTNQQELVNAIALAKAGHADLLCIGNEVLLRDDLPSEALIDYLRYAKKQLPELNITYADAYFIFDKYPNIAEACDVWSINCYPFWEKCPHEYAAHYMQSMYQQSVAIAANKPIIISETGWPSQGIRVDEAEPGYENAIDYFCNTFAWANQQNVAVFYFSAFDEAWKTGDEGDVGAYWGLWDQYGHFKFN